MPPCALFLASLTSFSNPQIAVESAGQARVDPQARPFAGTLYADIPYYPGAASCERVASGPCPEIPFGSTQCLDVRVPAVLAHAAPTILYVHGGGWGAGDKNDAEGVREFLDRLASLGYRVVSCNYTLTCDDPSTPDVYDAPSFPQAIADVRAAVGWIRTQGKASPYSLSDCVVIVGASAGAHLAAMAGVLNEDPAHFAPPGFDASTLGVRLTITFSPHFDLYRRGCFEGVCPCDACALGAHAHAAGFVGEPGDITQRFIGHRFGVSAPGYELWACPSDGFDYATFAPGSTTGDPFLNASPLHWLNAASSPFYSFRSRCDPFTPLAEHEWMTQAAAAAGVAFEERVEDCGHGLRIYGAVPSAHRVNQVIQGWSGYTRCP